MKAGPRPPWSEFRAALNAAGFRPSRRLGQNFLLDGNMARSIARDAGFGPGEFVLEVGPGCGFLTLHLAELGARVLAVEVDERLLAIARRLLAPFAEVEWLGCDVLAGKNRLAPEVVERLPSEGPWHVVSNLPYSVSGPVLALLADRDPAPASMTVLVQLEVAQRLAAEPGSSAWGPLSVALQVGYSVRLERTVARDLFWPVPQVGNGVVRLDLRDDRPPQEARARLMATVAALFQRRRQTLGRVVGDLLGGRSAAEALLGGLAIDPRRRAETLGIPELTALAEALPPAGSGGSGAA